MDTTINCEEYSELRKEDDKCIAIDVRSAEEFAAGHIEGAINLSVEEIESKIEDLVPDKDRLILLNCRSGGRAGRTAPVLEKMGYTNVHCLKGSYLDLK